LLAAIRKTDIKTVHLLLQKCVDINAKDNNGMIPLMCALELRCGTIINLLLNYADFNRVSKYGVADLMLNIKYTDTDTDNTLIHKGDRLLTCVTAPVKDAHK
jgi:ankyrin repeat protein